MRMNGNVDKQWSFRQCFRSYCVSLCMYPHMDFLLHVRDYFALWKRMFSAFTMALRFLLWLLITSLQHESCLPQNLLLLSKQTPSFVLHTCAISLLCGISASHLPIEFVFEASHLISSFLFSSSTCQWLLLVERHMPHRFFFSPPVRFLDLLFPCKWLCLHTYYIALGHYIAQVNLTDANVQTK